ncbi:hypothetical protein PCANC_12857 [Puccinia coronata f. sp. avenae]|uniref:Secreted RxLR effector peptide protein n=1 Tax=Puccinia coronata f. sp. avenae TaxID=200324 RepID=A0A2N5SPN9_9BASI|nr:hypothetical protein PCANC_12857 [Puccinia coronata f. sp. avenae]
MRFPVRHSLIFFGLLLASSVVVSMSVKTTEILEGLNKALAEPYRATVAAREDVPDVAFVSDRTRLLEEERVKKEKKLQETLDWGTSYGYGGKISAATWNGIKKSWNWLYGKLTAKLDGSLSQKERQALANPPIPHFVPPELMKSVYPIPAARAPQRPPSPVKRHLSKRRSTATTH